MPQGCGGKDRAVSDEAKFRAMDWLVGVATLVTLSLVSWLMITSNDHGNRITAVESTAQTQEQARVQKEEILDRMAEPPRWVEEKFRTLQKDQQLMIENQRQMQIEVRELTRKLDQLR
jgi:hypothetical protein